MSQIPATPVIENDTNEEDEQSPGTKYKAFTEFWRTLGQPASISATAQDVALPSKTEFSKFFMRSGPEDNEEFLRSICRGILNHDRAEEQGGAIGKGIDRSKVIPSITRPTWEPPALEVLDSFEVVDMELLKRSIPDPAARSRWLDIGGEMMALINYYEWVEETLRDAETAEDHEKEAFYEGLLQEVYDDLKEVYLECREFLLGQCNGPWISRRELFMQLIRMMDEWFDMGTGSNSAGSETSSTTSYATAIDESCLNTMEEMGNLIDLDSKDSDDENDINAIFKSTGLGELCGGDGGFQPSPSI